jgi:hypothetical protein
MKKLTPLVVQVRVVLLTVAAPALAGCIPKLSPRLALKERNNPHL